MHFFALFLRNYLVNSKKSSTFAAAFEKTGDEPTQKTGCDEPFGELTEEDCKGEPVSVKAS